MKTLKNVGQALVTVLIISSIDLYVCMYVYINNIISIIDFDDSLKSRDSSYSFLLFHYPYIYRSYIKGGLAINTNK